MILVPVWSRAIVAVAVLVLASAAAHAQSVPLPREKPGAATEPEEAAEPSSCLQDLQAAGVAARRAADFASDGQCMVEDPVVLEAVGTHNGLVSLPAHPMLDCRFAAAFTSWLGEVVNPIATSLLGSPVDEILTGPGHQCRNRAGGRLSEHAIGNAVDVSAFRLVDNRRIPIERMVEAEGAELEFLSAISSSACGYFTTVLGPGSDPAHADHLHVDLALRRITEFRICMTR